MTAVLYPGALVVWVEWHLLGSPQQQLAREAGPAVALVGKRLDISLT